MMSSVVVFGATGLIGTELLARLKAHNEVTSVAAYGRRAPKLQDATISFVKGTYDSLDDDLASWSPKAVFIALGTTIKKAGSQAAFRDVDFRMVVDAATWAQRSGVPTLALVSSVGADPASPFFYPRVKGEAEQALEALRFSRLVIARPGLLLGERDELRLGESVATPMMKLAAPILFGPLQKYRPISGKDVADAMVIEALGADIEAGTRVLEGASLFRS